MKVLVACEFSGIVRDAFIARGHDAWSCDLLPTEQPGPHFQRFIEDVMAQGASWDLLVAHPPCTYLSWAGNVWLKQPGRLEKRNEAMQFFALLASASVPRIAVENPKGYPCKVYRKPDQIIQPSQFGHPVHKPTCLWLKNLPLLAPTCFVEPEYKREPNNAARPNRIRHWTDTCCPGWDVEKRRKSRSRTFPGIAAAMAEQWGAL